MSWEVGSFAVLGVVLVAGFAWYERAHPSSRVLALVATRGARRPVAALPPSTWWLASTQVGFGLFVGILVLVSIVVIVILLTMGNQIANVFSNVISALG